MATSAAVVEQVVTQGERSIGKFLHHADVIARIIADLKETTLEEIHAKFAALPAPPDSQQGQHNTGLNKEVMKLYSLSRHHATLAGEEFMNAEMWIDMKTPCISDGNNFGVEVQCMVITKLARMRQQVELMVSGGLANYHYQRGTTWEKLLVSEHADCVMSSKSRTIERDGKTVDETKSKTESTTSKKPTIDDLVEYKLALDVQGYHAALTSLKMTRNLYINAHFLFEKNKKRLSDPRGDAGEDADGMSLGASLMY